MYLTKSFSIVAIVIVCSTSYKFRTFHNLNHLAIYVPHYIIETSLNWSCLSVFSVRGEQCHLWYWGKPALQPHPLPQNTQHVWCWNVSPLYLFISFPSISHLYLSPSLSLCLPILFDSYLSVWRKCHIFPWFFVFLVPRNMKCILLA